MKTQRRWKAHWIWSERPDPGTGAFAGGPPDRPADRFVLAARWFELDDASAPARCRVTADGRYVLYLNGTELSRGPVRSEAGLLVYDEVDLSPAVRPGRNVLTALVRHYGSAVAHWKPSGAMGSVGQGGFLLEGALGGDGAGAVDISTDKRWFVWTAGYRPGIDKPWGGSPASEIVDLADLPTGWPAPDSADGWQPAVVCAPAGLSVHDVRPPAGPFFELRPRAIAPLTARPIDIGAPVAGGTVDPGAPTDHPATSFGADIVRTAEVPPAATALAAGDWRTVDAGAIVNAVPVLIVQASPGAVIDLCCGEDLAEDGRPVTAPRHWGMRITATGGPDHIEAFEAVGFRYLGIVVREGSVHSWAISAIEHVYPVSGGAFACSDPELTELWRAGVRTLELCATDAFLDCPGRENRAWLGDAYVHTQLTMIGADDWRLAKENLRLHAQGARSDGFLPMVGTGDYSTLPVTIPDFSLHWVRTLVRVWEATGDDELAAELLPIAARLIRVFESHRDDTGGIRDVPGWLFIDWAQTGRGAYHAVLEGLVAAAATDLTTLADALGESGTARRLGAIASRSRNAFERYWDERRGVYVDALDESGRRLARVSQHTNALAILADAADSKRIERILAAVLDEARLRTTLTPAEGPMEGRLTHQWNPPPNFDEQTHVVRAQPFFAHFVHEALARADRIDLIPGLLRAWRPLVERGNGCLEEYWDAAPGRGSRAHAWSGTPSIDLTRRVLGLAPADHDGATYVLDPHLGHLDWAEGVVPTPHGPIQVRVSQSDGVTGIDRLQYPDGITLRLAGALVSRTTERTTSS